MKSSVPCIFATALLVLMATVSIGSCTDEDELSREETQIYGEPTISRYSGTGGKSEAAKGKGDLKSDETFSVGYARFAYGGLIGGGYHGLGGYGHGGYGYYNPYHHHYHHHRPYFGGYYGHRHHFNHGFHHGHGHGFGGYHHHHAFGPAFGFQAGIHLG